MYHGFFVKRATARWYWARIDGHAVRTGNENGRLKYSLCKFPNQCEIDSEMTFTERMVGQPTTLLSPLSIC